ncbi:NAD(P)-dependent oxidoreductase [Flavitalea flava]
MEKITKVAVIGGTGKSGKYLVKQLIHRQIPIKILVRNPDHFQLKDHLDEGLSGNNTGHSNENPLIEVVQGDVRDYSTVLSLLKGCQAVISTLGLGIPPSEKNVFSQATKNILRAMKVTGAAGRYIVITGLNVDTPFDKKGPKTKMATDWMYANYPLTTTDKQREYSILTQSAPNNINWTLVRLPMIEQTEESREISISLEDCPGDKVSAVDLARFLIGQLSDDTYSQKAPFIASR